MNTKLSDVERRNNLNSEDSKIVWDALIQKYNSPGYFTHGLKKCIYN